MSRHSIRWVARGFAVLLSLYGMNALAQSTPTEIRYRLSLAETKVALELVLPTLSESALKRNGVTQPAFGEPIESFTKHGEVALLWTLLASKNRADLPWLTVVFEPAREDLSPRDFRTFALKKFTKGAQSIKHLEHAGIPLARYVTDSPEAFMYAQHGVTTMGAKMTSHNLEAFLVGDQTWARIKLTAGSLAAEEEKAFYSAIESVRFVEISNPVTSFDYYSLGRAFLAKKDYQPAGAHFASAVKLEQTNPQLNAKHWRDLIMKAAEAYVAISDLAAAVELLEYGVTRDRQNETMLMQLARTHALMGDAAKTLATLEKAFRVMKHEKEVFEKTKFSGTTSHTMTLPDLNRDLAFKEMMKDKTFRDAVKAMKNSP